MRLLILLFIFIHFISFSQEKYHFDEIATYKINNGKRKEVVYFLYNNSDNSYFAKVEESLLNRNVLEVSFIVQNKLFSKTTIKKKNFLKAETLNLECNYYKVNNSKKNLFVKL